MFEYKIDNITIYNTAAFDIKPENKENLEKKIASWIIEHFERDILEDILERNYEGFRGNDKIRIMERLVSTLEKSKTSRKCYIESRLREYFSGEYLINIPGFVRFRLKEYRNDLEKLVDKVIDKYLCEKEYFEFIDLIKEYIKLQDTGISLLQILSTSKGTRYFDRYGVELTSMLEREYSFETDLSEADKLLTTLVLSAPQKIIWHNWEQLKNNELKTTVEEIFGSDLVLCKGCKFCKNNI